MSKMSRIDTALWHMEEPTNLMTITGMLIVDGELDFGRLRETIERRLLRFDRFRQRVRLPSMPFGRPVWEIDPHFDLKAHIHLVALPEPGDRSALAYLISTIMSSPLDYTKPLWQMVIVEQFEGGYALIGRIHHSVADGITLVKLLLSLTDEQPDTIWLEEESTGGTDQDGLVARILGPTVNRAQKASRLARTVRHQVRTVSNDPGQLAGAARLGIRSALRLGRMTLRLPDPRTPFKGELGVIKRAAWSQPLPLDEIKAIGAVMGGTINDVMVTIVTGALRRYLEAQGRATTGLQFRAYIPVNMRHDSAEIELGNRLSTVFLRLPVGVVDQVERLQIVKQRMDALKDTTEAFVGYTFLSAAGFLPKELEIAAFNFYHTKATALLTNVPGPKQQLYLAGKPVSMMMGWVPQSGRLGLGITVFSYNGQIYAGVSSDAGLVPDPERIMTFLESEFEEMLLLLRQQEEEEE